MHAGNERAVRGGVSGWLAALPVVVGLFLSIAAAEPGAVMTVAKLSAEEAKAAGGTVEIISAGTMGAEAARG